MFSFIPSHVLKHALPRADSNYVLALTTKITLLYYLRNKRSFKCWLISDDFSLDSGNLLGFTDLMLIIFTIFCLLRKLWFLI